ncbi:MAG TPA: proline dehydrogenase [Bacteroidetes bacterium]|jgi:proline dehydrogenase|nr:proline dehydrogenase [Bacteroidota bacterium]
MNLLNKLVVAAIPLVPKSIVRIFAGRYIAGETIEDAIRCVRQLNSEGVCATLDVLGEDVTNKNEALQSRSQSIEVLHTIAKEKLDSNLSIKLTSLGLKLGKDICTANVREILNVAKQHGLFVRFDMEDSTCTSDTIEIFQTLQKDHPNIGIVLQSYMRRSEDDVKALMVNRTNFRWCKGIYKEPPAIAFQGRKEVQDNFVKILELMLGNKCYVGIATHDSVLIDAAYRLINELGLKKNEYEFQMLLGVRPELRRKLVGDGHKVRLYVPFGEHWYGYSTRRFKENPEVAGYVFKALFTRNV